LKLNLVSPNPCICASLRLPPEASPADQNRIRDYNNRLTQIAQGTSTVGCSYDTANRRSILTLSNLRLQCDRNKHGVEVGAMLSPALALGHEMAHTQYSNFWLLIDDDAYKNLQEKYVITDYEMLPRRRSGGRKA
jgi:hypothetical protein